MGIFSKFFGRIFDSSGASQRSHGPKASSIQISISLPNRTKGCPPFGEYFWAMSPDAYESAARAAEERRAHCTVFASPEIERQAFYVLHLTTFGLLPMLLRGVVSLRPEIVEWFRSLERAESIARFGCYPVSVPPVVLDPLPSNRELFLYEYLACRTRKKEFSVENTPKAIKEYFSSSDLEASYRSLETQGLMEHSGNSWRHAPTPAAKAFREAIVETSAIGAFISAIESATNSVFCDLSRRSSLGLKVYGRTAEGTVCPICSKLPTIERELLPSEYESLFPFHYRCPMLSIRVITEEYFIESRRK